MPDANTISMESQGSVFCRPDTCFVNLYAEGAGYSVAKAVRECDRIVDEVRESVVPAFSPHLSFRVGEFHVGSPEDRSFRASFEEPRRGTPWVVHVKRLYFSLPPDAQMAHDVIDAALLRGAILVPSVGAPSLRSHHPAILYGIQDYGAHRQRAIEQAIAAAREDAEKAAHTLGKSCGDVTSFVLGSSLLERGSMGTRYDITLPLPGHQLTSTPEELKVNVIVRVSFELVDIET